MHFFKKKVDVITHFQSVSLFLIFHIGSASIAD